MASNTHARERSAASQPYLATSSFGQSTAERCTRSMRKNVAEGSSSLPKRSRRSTTVSSQSSEDGDSVRLTKTGRVSKALKGQPVHTCDVCSKVRLSSQLFCLLTITTHLKVFKRPSGQMRLSHSSISSGKANMFTDLANIFLVLY